MALDPNTEADRTITLSVAIDTFGRDDERDLRSMVVAVSRAIHSRVGLPFRVTDARGRTWLYDPLADDGHHDGHVDSIVQLP